MHVLPCIRVQRDLCADWFGPAGQSAFIPLRPAGVARNRCGQQMALPALSSIQTEFFAAGVIPTRSP